MKGGRHQFFLLSSIRYLLLFFAVFPSFVEAKMKCATAGACAPYSVFLDHYDKFDVGPNTTKECKEDNDICAAFWCLIDGKKVLHGFGCYSDYVSICGEVSNTIQLNVSLIDEKWPTGHAYGKNARVYGCKFEGYENCANKTNLFWDSFKYFTGHFTQDAGEDLRSYDKKCLYAPGAPEETGGSNGPSKPKDHTEGSNAMKQMNGFQVFGIILLGLILAQFW